MQSDTGRKRRIFGRGEDGEDVEGGKKDVC